MNRGNDDMTTTIDKPIQIFTGSPSYCEKKALELLNRQWRVVKKTFWADGKVTYKMEWRKMEFSK
jgi:hypothetical protein